MAVSLSLLDFSFSFCLPPSVCLFLSCSCYYWELSAWLVCNLLCCSLSLFFSTHFYQRSKGFPFPLVYLPSLSAPSIPASPLLPAPPAPLCFPKPQTTPEVFTLLKSTSPNNRKCKRCFNLCLLSSEMTGSFNSRLSSRSIPGNR